jgi:2-polyprenyl-6-methoxyphenol hydroxylase-like FAD-dependent oxidoreductase
MAAPLDVLVVGGGPTGLALAAQLRAYGTRFRIVDRSPDRVRESRALAVQPRTLEALAGFGVTDELVARGNPAMRLRMHLPRRVVSLRLFDIGLSDTAYPFLLFLSQAETESVLAGQLAARGVAVERGTELVRLEEKDAYVVCRLRGPDGSEETVRARYVVGCDGAHSTVRAQAGIGFEGYAYPQTFLLADLEVDGLEPDAVHTYLAGNGMLFFFPLGSPATWRMLAMRPPDAPDAEVTVSLLQETVGRYTDDHLVLRDPAWMTDFRLHNRGAARYRAGRCFLAGDAAHIHSPAGAQGMNTGILETRPRLPGRRAGGIAQDVRDRARPRGPCRPALHRPRVHPRYQRQPGHPARPYPTRPAAGPVGAAGAGTARADLPYRLRTGHPLPAQPRLGGRLASAAARPAGRRPAARPAERDPGAVRRPGI